ncbi:MAG: hypothetical protein WD095_00660, partial [Candidatus Paceibacterota bacterium]
IIAITIITGIFISTIKAQRQSNHLTVLNSDTGLILEKMMREVREGYDFSDLPGNCVNTSSESLSFTRIIEEQERVVRYSLNRSTNNIERREGGGNAVPLNSSQVAVESLCFLETQQLSNHPWRITVAIKSGSIDPSIDYTANLQTTISARPLPSET